MRTKREKHVAERDISQSREVPHGWQNVSLSQVGTIVTGNTPSKNEPENYGNAVLWVKPPDLEQLYPITATKEFLSEKGAKKSRLLPAGSTMISCIGILGKVGIAGTTVATNQQINSIIFHKELVDEKYGFYYCKTLKQWLEDHASATTIPIINKSKFSQAPFLLPPLPEQKRIVARIEELLPRVNAVRERLIRVKEIMKRFRQSVLAAACSGRLTEDWRDNAQSIESSRELIKRVLGRRKKEYDAEWGTARRKRRRDAPKPNYYEFREAKIDDLPEIPEDWDWAYLPFLGYMNRGKSQHRPRNAPHLYGGPYPFIQTGDIAQSGGKITSHRQTYNEEGLKQSRIWPQGTVSITIAANIAHSGILSYPACFPDSVVGVIPDSDLCRGEFLEYFIRTARSNLDEFAPATSQKNINVAILSDLAVPLPPLVEQTEIVRRLELLFKLADKIEKRVEVELSRTEKITQAILAKAFRGELVPSRTEMERK